MSSALNKLRFNALLFNCFPKQILINFAKRKNYSTTVGGSENGYLPFPKGFTYKIIHESYKPDQSESLSLVQPLVLSTTFKQIVPGKPKEFRYSRLGNPLRKTLENCLVNLENGKHGFLYSSGLGAATGIMALLSNGDHIICGEDHYSGVVDVFDKTGRKFGIEPSFVDMRDAKKIENAIKPNTKLIFVETVSNPTMRVADIGQISKIAKKHNLLFAVDNTFLTPFLTKPLDLGADIVMHSATKYINGHTDVIMGAIITNRDELKEKFRATQEDLGIIPSPFDCYMVLRGLKTLELRMLKHMENATAVAEFLEKHPKIEKVVFPGLPSHPSHEIFKKQSCGPSGMCTIYLKGGINETKKFLNGLKVFTSADSLGGYESLVNATALMTHGMAPEVQKKLEITDTLIRMSIGLEDKDYLIRDLDQALNLL